MTEFIITCVEPSCDENEAYRYVPRDMWFNKFEPMCSICGHRMAFEVVRSERVHSYG